MDGVENPLDFIDFAEILAHGDPDKWKFRGPKPGSPTPAKSTGASPGTMKHYDLYEDEFGDEIEVHDFRKWMARWARSKSSIDPERMRC